MRRLIHEPAIRRRRGLLPFGLNSIPFTAPSSSYCMMTPAYSNTASTFCSDSRGTLPPFSSLNTVRDDTPAHFPSSTWLSLV